MPMKIIISPAKKMKVNTDTLEVRALPVYLHEAEYLQKHLSERSYEELKSLWKCNDQIAQINYERLQKMNLRMQLTPALLSYEGIQYQYMAPAVLEDGQWEYVQEHVCILSGLYGVVRPLDGVTPYRLEMQTKVSLPNVKNLYEYWGDKIYREVSADTEVIVNLASKEYSKMARGEMVRFLAEHKAEKLEEMKRFCRLGYRYSEKESTKDRYVFLKEQGGDK